MTHTTHYHSPIGCFEIKGSSEAIQSLRLLPAPVPPSGGERPAVLEACAQQLAAYFARKLQRFDVPLDWSDATDFHQSVWAALLHIPYGRTSSYSAIAEAIGRPDAVRAVGMANGYNPIAIIVPCHRVIAKSGHLQGYFYGLDVKRQLLELENPVAFARQGELF